MTTQQQQGTSQWPYGIDPRQFGLSKHEYHDALRFHREMEHYDVMAEKREQDRIQSEHDDHVWRTWTEPLTAFCYFAGTIFWCFLWWHIFFTALPNMGRAVDRIDAANCLKDLPACQIKADGVTIAKK